MNIDKKLDDGRLTLRVEGRLDTNTSPELESELKFDGVRDVVFDFGGLEYISSAGLRVLMVAYKAMTACGGSMSVVNPNTIVKGVFDMTGMSSVFNVVSDAEAERKG
jgi:anti-sigma B factor antagonist